MSYFKAKMRQIRFRLGLRPRPRWGSLQCSPDPVAGFKGPTSKGRGGDGRGGEDKGKGEGGKGREGKDNRDRPPTIFGLKVALGSVITVGVWLESGLGLRIVVYKLLEKVTRCGSITWLKLTNGDPPRRPAPLRILSCPCRASWRGLSSAVHSG